VDDYIDDMMRPLVSEGVEINMTCKYHVNVQRRLSLRLQLGFPGEGCTPLKSVVREKPTPEAQLEPPEIGEIETQEGRLGHLYESKGIWGFRVGLVPVRDECHGYGMARAAPASAESVDGVLGRADTPVRCSVGGASCTSSKGL
jgi:hypothetical protein